MALGPAALRLVYGEEYRRTAGPLLVMLAVLPLVPLLQTSMALLVGVGRQWFPLALGVLAAVVNITLDVILIPRHAALGAATANAVAQIIASVAIVAYAVNVARGITWEGAALCRAAIAAGLSGLAAVVVVRTIGGVAGVALGALVWTLAFCLSARVLHILSASDAAWLEGTLGRRTRRLARFVLATGR